MKYLSYIPSAPLDAYIQDFYYIEGRAPYLHFKVFPMPTLHLMINFGPAFHVRKSNDADVFASCVESCWIGLWSQSHLVEWPSEIQFYGVHFKPAGVYPFLRLPLSELHNQIVAGDAIWRYAAGKIRERLYAAPTIQAGFALLERWLLTRLREAPYGLDVVQYTIQEFATHQGVLSIRELSDQIGISHNQLGRQFKQMVGIPPKALARFYRFANVLQTVDPTQDVDWTRIAHQAQFYDQSHFNKEFLTFTGFTPTDYLRIRRQLHIENPHQAQNLGQLPVW
jgi:AraC-like DNA-binding protein